MAIRKFIIFLNNISLNYSRTVIIIYSIIIIIFSIGISKIVVESGGLDYFKKESYIYKSDMRISQLFRGATMMNLIVDSGKIDGVKDPEFLKMTEEVREWIVRPESQDKYNFLS